MNQAERQKPLSEPSEADIAAYLVKHPDFFKRHTDALEAIEAHHASGNAASLIERQVDSLRTSNRQLESRLNELFETARDNEQRVVQLNQLAKVLVTAESAPALAEELADCLHEQIDVDRIYIGIEGSHASSTPAIHHFATDDAAGRALTNVFRRGKPMCGPLSADQIDALFATADEPIPKLQSAAMIPLGVTDVHGALVLASEQPSRFVPEMGTLFLELAGGLVTAALRRLLGADALP